MLTQNMETQQMEIDSSRMRKDIRITAVQSNTLYIMTLHFKSVLVFFYFHLSLSH